MNTSQSDSLPTPSCSFDNPPPPPSLLGATSFILGESERAWLDLCPAGSPKAFFTPHSNGPEGKEGLETKEAEPGDPWEKRTAGHRGGFSGTALLEFSGPEITAWASLHSCLQLKLVTPGDWTLLPWEHGLVLFPFPTPRVCSFLQEHCGEPI